MLAALDFETYYDDEYSVSSMPTSLYCRDPRFDGYWVSVAKEDGFVYSGPPSGLDWSVLRGCEVLTHNAVFDTYVLQRLQRDGVAPKDTGIVKIHDTLDMAVFFGSGRASLAAAAQNFLGVTLSKDTRSDMKGKRWNTVSATELGLRLKEYASQDAETTLRLGQKLLPDWPAVEREASRVTREGGQRGLPLDLVYLKASLDKLEETTHKFLKSIPWYPDEKPLSTTAMREEARKCGIPFPASLDKRDPAAEEWIQTYSKDYPWVMAVRDYRSANTLLKRVQALWTGRDGDVYPFELAYFGADTGRWSGGGRSRGHRRHGDSSDRKGRFNTQSMPRDAMFDVDLRRCFKAPEGKAFYVGDYGQIEHRFLLWRVGDFAALDMIRSGVHPYKAYAIRHMGAPTDLKSADPMYLAAKACVLGCGYQAWGKAFMRAAKALAGLDLDEERATEMVKAYREANPRVVAYWAKHHRGLAMSANHQDPTHEVELASGRWLKYYDPICAGTDSYNRPSYKVRYALGEEHESCYGGLLTENEIQATARDVLRDGWVALEAKGFDVPLTVHDEYVALGPSNPAEQEDYKHEFERIATSSSPWAEGCPISLKLKVFEHYQKG